MVFIPAVVLMVIVIAIAIGSLAFVGTAAIAKLVERIRLRRANQPDD